MFLRVAMFIAGFIDLQSGKRYKYDSMFRRFYAGSSVVLINFCLADNQRGMREVTLASGLHSSNKLVNRSKDNFSLKRGSTREISCNSWPGLPMML